MEIQPAMSTGPSQNLLITRQRGQIAILMIVTALAIYLCFRLIQPFLPSVAWAVALAVAAWPLHAGVLAYVRKPSLAAGISVGLIASMILTPAIFVIFLGARQAIDFFQSIEEQITSEGWRQYLDDKPTLASMAGWIESSFDVPRELTRLSTSVIPHIQTVVANSLGVVVDALITLFILFYLLRDQRKAIARLRSLMPLSTREANEVLQLLSNTIKGTIYGSLFVSMIQGTLGGLMFWFLGIPSPVFWGLTMGLAAMVPYLGAFIVWAPVAGFLALQGHFVSALILTGWGIVVVGSIDNLLWPVLVGNQVRMHSALLFLAVLGGLLLFGASGLILGPLILALTLAIGDIWRRRASSTRRSRTSFTVGMNVPA